MSIEVMKEEMERWLEALEPVAVYKAYNGDDFPAVQVAPVVASLRQSIQQAENLRQSIQQAEKQPVLGDK